MFSFLKKRCIIPLRVTLQRNPYTPGGPMREKYEWMLNRWEELEQALAQPEVAADPERWQQLSRERTELEERVTAWKRYLELQRMEAEARELEHDPELAEDAQAELKALGEEKAELEQRLRVLLLPVDRNDDRSVVMEIRAGTGGEEAALFAGDLYRMYQRYAASHGWKTELLSVSESDLGGVKEGVFLVTGRGVYARLKYESGVHRVQRVPVTDTTGKKQTSTCTVAVLPEAEEVDLRIDPADLRIDTYRASGHGGQYVNRTDSAIRITHLPTGIVVTCQDQKSQLKNKEQAMKVLRSRLLDKMQREADADYAQKRRVQVGTGDRSERIRTYNFHEGRVTDHRIGLTLYKIGEIMDGALDEIIDALRAEEQAMLLREAEGN